MNKYYVYIMSTYNNAVIYIGVTNNLVRRVNQHKNKQIEGYTSRYNVTKLVYYEEYDDINKAITREKQIKGITRERKNKLIFQQNPKWIDLSKNL